MSLRAHGAAGPSAGAACPPARKAGFQAACVLAFDGDGRVALTTRPTNPAWVCMPGGKVDPGETLVEAAVRELAEETGLVVDPGDLIEVHRGPCRGDGASVDSDTTTFLCLRAFDALPGSREEKVQARTGQVVDLLEQSPFAHYNRQALASAAVDLVGLVAWMALPAADRQALEAARHEIRRELELDLPCSPSKPSAAPGAGRAG